LSYPAVQNTTPNALHKIANYRIRFTIVFTYSMEHISAPEYAELLFTPHIAARSSRVILPNHEICLYTSLFISF